MYLDPGTGSLILQAIIGAFLAIGVFFRIFGKKVKAFFGFGKETENDENTPNEE